ncbi:hypothetical protein L207DRAFT_532422 [Hyaloscypha variabilis F]|uniref:Uncharacterized protein n=1 Tax=Hyaloscypha variabilis (strain UAMH 11265 / GT02V1 / F) TaxID=1149755 RepID=A0A2J6RE97_HYAVF|nr:hypothetical protein L207DRAFT_532422 [Hyaloscypha variabilis F]
MHPIDEVLAREGKEQNAEQREYYTTMYQELHSDLREKILTCPPEFLTRRLALFFVHQYNTTLTCPSPSPSPNTLDLPSTSTDVNDPRSLSTPTFKNLESSTAATLNDPASADTPTLSTPAPPAAPAPTTNDPASPDTSTIDNPAPHNTPTANDPQTPTTAPLCTCPSPPLTLTHPTAADTSFLHSLSLLTTFNSLTHQITSLLQRTTRKFARAPQHQQEETEYILLAVEKLEAAVQHVKEAQLDVLFRELERDEGSVFEEMVGRGVLDMEGVAELVEGLCGLVLEGVGGVEGEEDGDFSDESDDGDYTAEHENDDEDDRGDEGLSVIAEEDEGRVDARLSALDLPRRHHSSGDHEHMIRHALQFLDAAKAMMASLTQTELWVILDECRKIVEQARGINIVLSPALLNDRPGLDKSGTYHPGGLGDVIVSALVTYRQHISQNNGVIDERVEKAALGFINFVKERNDVASGTYPKSSLWDRDACRRYYEAAIPCAPVFVKRLKEYIMTVLDNGWKFDEHVLEALEVLIAQAKGKACLDIEEEYSDSSRGDSPAWQGQEKIAVWLRGYSKLCEDEQQEVDGEVLRLAREVIDRAKRYEKHDPECECAYCGRQTKERTCSGYCGNECVCVVMLVEDDEDVDGDSEDEDDDETFVMETVGSRPLPPIYEDPEAEAASESDSNVVVEEGHMSVMIEDGNCEDVQFVVEI